MRHALAMNFKGDGRTAQRYSLRLTCRRTSTSMAAMPYNTPKQIKLDTWREDQRWRACQPPRNHRLKAPVTGADQSTD
jgi:hypothetical protein